MQDRLINGQTIIIRHIEFAQGSARKVYVTFFKEQAWSKAMNSSYLGRQNIWGPITKCETEISIKQRSVSLSIKFSQFPLTLAWASAIQSVQSLSLGRGVVDFDLQKQKSFGPRQMYTALMIMFIV